MKLKLLTAAVAVAALGASAGVQAKQTFSFDPTGSGTPITDQAFKFNWNPGNALAENGITAFNNFISNANNGTSLPVGFTLHYQANLNTIQDENGATVFANGISAGHDFTAVAGFGEQVFSASQPDPQTNNASFVFDPSNSTNYFNIYATSALGNDLTGVGFDPGTAPVLQATVRSIDPAQSNFTVDPTTSQNMDQTGTDNWSGQQTVKGTGASDITLTVTAANPLFFPSLNPSSQITLSFFNTSQIDPFKQANPSKCMNLLGNACDGVGGGYSTVGTLGSLNGIDGPNFLMQSVATQRLQVPEPGTVALLGLGLAVMGFVGFKTGGSGRPSAQPA